MDIGRTNSAQSSSLTRHWRADLLWGAAVSGGFAAFYSIWVLVLTVLRWNTYWPNYHTTTWRIIAGYWGAAAVVGVVLALLRPRLGRRWGAALAGLLCGAVVYAVIGLTMQDMAGWGAFATVGILGGLGGMGLGVVRYDDEHGKRISTGRELHRIALIVGGGIVAGLVIWAMCYPPFCWLGGRYCR